MPFGRLISLTSPTTILLFRYSVGERLKRVWLTVTDDIPTEAVKIRFYYTGGSSATSTFFASVSWRMSL